MNYFKILQQPEQLALDLDTLKEKYQQLAGANHPDKGGDETVFRDIGVAYDSLKSLHLRIKHLLELNGHTVESRGTVSDSVMNFFMPIGDLVQSVDTHHKAFEQAKSALAKAMLAPKTMELQDQLEKQIDALDAEEQTIASSITSQTQAIDEIAEPLQIAARDLTFLNRWKAQLREKYGGLFGLSV